MKPADEKQLAEAIAAADEPLIIRGGETRGMVRNGHTTLSAAGLTGVSLYEPGALTIVVKAGTPVAEIQKLLKSEGQCLAFEPMDHRGLLGSEGTPTIGGVVAANISGPRRIQVGACRDFLLGVRFVDGSGRVIKNGGRVMKNVTGYDLCKLLAGSHGTLGVLSEVALKVLPEPETSATLTIHGLSDAGAVQAMSTALGSPYDVSGAACFSGGESRTFVRLEGFEKSVTYRTQQLTDLLSGFGEVAVETGAKSANIWENFRDIHPFHDQNGDVWKISVKPTDGPEIAARLNAKGVIFDWGGGLIWAMVSPGTDLRRQIGEFQGHATLVRADQETKDRIGVFQPQARPVATISAGIRSQFDPKGIFNPGLMG